MYLRLSGLNTYNLPKNIFGSNSGVFENIIYPLITSQPKFYVHQH